MMRQDGLFFYDRLMLGAATGYLRELLRRHSELIPIGFNWAFVITVDVTMLGGGVIATLQRPSSDLPVALAAFALAVSPLLLFLVYGMKAKVYEAPLLLAAWTTATAIFLFGTSTPITGDFAPLLLVLMVGVVGALTSMPGGLIAAITAAALLLTASAMHRIDAIVMYLSFIGIGWLVGYLIRIQQQLMLKQQAAQAQLAEHAVADERRRIAREVHDVIAHSLSITLLHITGARRGLQQERDVDDAVDALEQAEQLGRQAMADIRRTVGLLDSAPMNVAPEPGVADIASLVSDFSRAGLNVALHVDGQVDRVSAAVGLALYRIAQESLANIAKHAPDSRSTVALAISRTSARLTIENELPVTVAVSAESEGRGLRGMRQRVELLGGSIIVGPSDDGWAVVADVPLGEAGSSPSGWFCGA